MSTAVAPTVSIAFIGLSAVYTLREYYLPLKNQHVKDKERIRALEEEVIRLKREMRSCGIMVPPCSLTDPAYENHPR